MDNWDGFFKELDDGKYDRVLNHIDKGYVRYKKDMSKNESLDIFDKLIAEAAPNVPTTSYLFYGDPGAGKTTLMKYMPGKTFIISSDRGESVLRDKEGKFPDNMRVLNLLPDLSNLIPALEALQSNCPFDNVVVDTVTEIERTMLTYYGSIGKNNGVPERGDYQRTQFKIMDYCRQIRALPCNTVFTFWQENFQITMQSGETYNKARPMISSKIVENICGLCDVIGYIRKADDGERIVVFEGGPNAIARDRINKRSSAKFDEVFI